MAKKSIGEANVKLTVEGAEQVASKLKDVKSEMDATASAAGSAGGRIDGAFKNAGESVNKATGGIRALAASLTGVLGIVSALSAVFGFAFGAIVRKIKDAKQETEDFKASLEELRKAGKEISGSFADVGKDEADQIVQIEEDLARKRFELNAKKIKDLEENFKKQAEIERELSRSQSGEVGGRDSLESRLEKLRDLQKELNEETKKQITIAEREARSAIDRIQKRIDARNAESEAANLAPIIEAARQADERANQQAQSNAQRRIDLLEGEEKEREKLALLEQVIQEQIRQAEEEGNSRLIQSLRERLELEREIANVRIMGIRDAESAKQTDTASRRLSEALDRNTKAVQDSARFINENNQKIERLYQQVVNLVPAVKKTAEESTRRRVV